MQRSLWDTDDVVRTSGLADPATSRTVTSHAPKRLPGASSPVGFARTVDASLAHSPTVANSPTIAQPVPVASPARVGASRPSVASVVLALGIFAASIGAAVGYVLS